MQAIPRSGCMNTVRRWWWWLLLYSAILHSWADSLCSHVILHEWLAFYSAFLEYSLKWCTYSAAMTGATWNCCLGLFCVHHATMHHVTSRKATYTKGVCVFSCNLPPALLAEWPGSFTCYCSNMGWNRYRNKSQHRKLTLEKKIIPPLLQGLEPATFQSWVSNHSCRHLNLLPFNHESGTLTTELSLQYISFSLR